MSEKPLNEGCPRCAQYEAERDALKIYSYEPHEVYIESDRMLWIDVAAGYEIALSDGRLPVWNDATDEKFVATVNSHDLTPEHLDHVPYSPGLMLTLELHLREGGAPDPCNVLADGNHRAASALKYGRPAIYYLLTVEESMSLVYNSREAIVEKYRREMPPISIVMLARPEADPTFAPLKTNLPAEAFRLPPDLRRGESKRGTRSASGYIMPESFKRPPDISLGDLFRGMRVESRPLKCAACGGSMSFEQSRGLFCPACDGEATPTNELQNITTRIEIEGREPIETHEERREVSIEIEESDRPVMDLLTREGHRPHRYDLREFEEANNLPAGSLGEEDEDPQIEEELACKICGAPIESAELCSECAKTNDPFDADPDAHEHRPRTEV